MTPSPAARSVSDLLAASAAAMQQVTSVRETYRSTGTLQLALGGRVAEFSQTSNLDGVYLSTAAHGADAFSSVSTTFGDEPTQRRRGSTVAIGKTTVAKNDQVDAAGTLVQEGSWFRVPSAAEARWPTSQFGRFPFVEPSVAVVPSSIMLRPAERHADRTAFLVEANRVGNPDLLAPGQQVVPTVRLWIDTGTLLWVELETTTRYASGGTRVSHQVWTDYNAPLEVKLPLGF